MLNEELEKYKKFFYDFVNEYYNDDIQVNKNVKLKYNHTLRVCKNIVEIAKSLRLNKNDINLAEVIALFHDIGRFEQLRLYNTFNDKISEDHSELSVKILKSENILKNINDIDREIIYTAIKYHNKRIVPDSIDKRTELFSKLIRDSDKLDILKVLSEYYKDENKDKNSTLELDLNDNGECSDSVLNDIFKKAPVNFENIKNTYDYKLGQISWIFDINFDYTLKKIVEYKYIDMILNTLPKKDKINKVKAYIQDYLTARL